jgi:hypothetical protein
MPDPVLWQGYLCKANAFVMVLCYSRLLDVEFSLATKLADFLRCHQNALRFFGGAPKTCVYDNLSSVVKRRRGTDITLNETFQQFAGYHYFQVHPCWPGAANQKGTVERPIDYIANNFWAGRYFADFDDLVRKGQAWVMGTANARIHSTTRRRPVEHFEEERGHLLALPAEPFDTDWVLYPKVRKDCVVRVDTNDCSVPWKYAQRHRDQAVEVRVDSQWVRIMEDDGEEKPGGGSLCSTGTRISGGLWGYGASFLRWFGAQNEATEGSAGDSPASGAPVCPRRHPGSLGSGRATRLLRCSSRSIPAPHGPGGLDWRISHADYHPGAGGKEIAGCV